MGEFNLLLSEGLGWFMYIIFDWLGWVVCVFLIIGLYISCSVSYFVGVMS